MNSDWQAYLQTLTKELGVELAHEFVGSLHTQSNGSQKTAARFFYQMGLKWAPLMQAWQQWLVESAENYTTVVILRDAKPLLALPNARNDWKRLYLNRLICGIPDELSGDTSGKHHPLLSQYIIESEWEEERIRFVDSGCYGTIILQLHKLGMKLNQPFFFFSKNPYIRGFLNETGVTMEEGTILNDSLECVFPHMVQRPSELREYNGKIEAVLRSSDLLSVWFGTAAMQGLRDADAYSGISTKEAIQALLVLSQKAREGNFTGVLGHESPEWSGKKEFFARWPQELRW